MIKIIFFLFSIQLLASPLNINYFEANFKQTITSNENSILTYTGKLFVKKAIVLWKYKTPIAKTIYISENKAIIIEPELEQVIIKKIDKIFDFFTLLNNAKLIDKNLYKAVVSDNIIFINVSNNKVKNISYIDDLENKNFIEFSNISTKKIEENKFNIYIDSDYDIIE